MNMQNLQKLGQKLSFACFLALWALLFKTNDVISSGNSTFSMYLLFLVNKNWIAFATQNPTFCQKKKKRKKKKENKTLILLLRILEN